MQRKIYLFYYCDLHKMKSSYRLEYASSSYKRFKKLLVKMVKERDIDLHSNIDISKLPDEYNLKDLNQYINYGQIEIMEDK